MSHNKTSQNIHTTSGSFWHNRQCSVSAAWAHLVLVIIVVLLLALLFIILLVIV
jgi:hypothetical protein